MADSNSSWSIFGIIKATVAGALLILVFFGLAYRMTLLQKTAEARDTTKTVKLRTEDQELFYDLLRAKLLKIRADTGVDMVPSDFLMIKEAANDKTVPAGTTRAEQERLLKALYYSAVGVIVRQQVRLWNATRRISAVRDNRPVAEGEENKAVWHAFSASGHPHTTGDLVPETFGFIHQGSLSTGFSKWLTVPSETEPVTFRTRVAVPSARTITIQIIGNPVALPPGATVERKQVAFIETKANWPCTLASKAAIIRVPVRASRAGVPLSVTVEPAVNCAPAVFGLAISMSRVEASAAPKKDGKKPDPAGKDAAKDADKNDDPNAVPPSGIIDVKVPVKERRRRRAKDKEPQFKTVKWQFNWRPVKRSRRGEGRFSIITSDGLLLTDAAGRGRPADLAYDLGLLPIVGFGPADASSLIGLLGQSKTSATGLEVRLTIESRKQRIVQSTINHYLGEIWGNTRWSDVRKAAIVLLDADTGAILAVGGWPQPPKNATPWDYTSFAAANPTRDPMSVMAWEVIDRNNTPGSTFKPLMALSMLQSNRPRINRIMKGMSPGELSAATGLGPGTATYFIAGTSKSISNFGQAPLGRYFQSQSRSADCVANPTPEFGFGLKQAIQFSINVWFARLAVLLDQADADAWIRSLPLDKNGKTTRIYRTLPLTNAMKALRSIGINDEKRMDLAPNVPPRLGLFRYQTENGADILYAQVPRTAVTSGEPMYRDNPSVVRTGYLHRIALNGIGQAWSVSVMHMARGVATIASGKRVQPHLFRSWGPVALTVPDAPALKVDQEALNVLRLGMKAVPEAPGSTAIGTFISPPSIVDGMSGAELRKKEVASRLATIRKTLKCRSFGKTGTADVAKGLGYNSGWFVGWKNPLKPGGRKIAFACMTTHVFGNFRFGGTSCGRMIRDILTSIEYVEMARADGAKPKLVPPPKATQPGPAPPRPAPGRTPGDPTNLQPRPSGPGTPPADGDPDKIPSLLPPPNDPGNLQPD